MRRPADAPRASRRGASRPRTGTMYLLHFDRRHQHAGHYCGWASDLTERMIEHQSGRGARLIEVIIGAGNGFTLARTWPDTDRHFERRLHRRKESPRLCPICAAERRGQLEFAL
jgi:hypothetical protein